MGDGNHKSDSIVDEPQVAMRDHLTRLNPCQQRIIFWGFKQQDFLIIPQIPAQFRLSGGSLDQQLINLSSGKFFLS